MNPLERLAEKLSLTRAEILTISVLLAFLLLGGILRQIQSSELEAAAMHRAEAAIFSDAETDSLIQLAMRDQARIEEIIKESLEKKIRQQRREKAGWHANPQISPLPAPLLQPCEKRGVAAD